MIQLCPHCKKQWCESVETDIKEFVSQTFREKNYSDICFPYPILMKAGKKLILENKYRFHCPKCGGKWETNNKADDQTEEYKNLGRQIMASPISDNPLKNYKDMKFLLRYKDFYDKLSDTRFSEKQIEEHFEELSNQYINQFLDIPYTKRRFIVVVNELTYLPDSFIVLPINNIPHGITFPSGHPHANELYVAHERKSHEYIPYRNYQTTLFRDEFEEFTRIMRCLGAKSIIFNDNVAKNKKATKKTSQATSIGGGHDLYGEGKVGFSEGEENNEYKKLVDELMTYRKLDINPKNPPFMPQNVVWYPLRSKWQECYESRMAGQERHFTFKLSTEEYETASKQERMNIEADLKVLSYKANGSHEQEENVSLHTEESHTWTVDVEFYPLSAYNTSDNNKKLPQNIQSATLTAEEDEYLTELKEILADGEISPRERRLLEKIRTQLGISEERAAELENSLTALQLTEEEQEYLDEYKEIVADGEITDKKRRLLDKILKMNGISEERAREIEASVKR